MIKTFKESNYTPLVKFFGGTRPQTGVFWHLNIFLNGSKQRGPFMLWGGQATVLNGAKYRKASKRQSIRLVANRPVQLWTVTTERLKGFKRVCSDNNHSPSLETFHFDEIIVHWWEVLSALGLFCQAITRRFRHFQLWPHLIGSRLKVSKRI